VKLSGDEDFGVRMVVAENPSTPLDVLMELSRDRESKNVRNSAAEALKKLQEKQASTNQRRFNKIARYLRISNLKN
jgi:uncharacterized protein (UPF0147 family)